MARVVFETTSIIPPNNEQTDWDIARETFTSLYEVSPELQDLCWHITVRPNPGGARILCVSVDDPKLPSDKENLRLICYLILIMIVTGLLAYA